RPDLSAWLGKVPVLAICYGAQYIADYFGGEVARSDKREYGKAQLHLAKPDHPLLADMAEGSQVWMSHGDTILSLPTDFEILASTPDIPVAIYASRSGAFEQP